MSDINLDCDEQFPSKEEFFDEMLPNCKRNRYYKKIVKLVSIMKEQAALQKPKLTVKVRLLNYDDAKKCNRVDVKDINWRKKDVPDGDCTYFYDRKYGKLIEINLYDKNNLGEVDERLFLMFLHEWTHAQYYLKGFVSNHPSERTIWCYTIQNYFTYCNKFKCSIDLLMDIMYESLASYKEYCRRLY